MAFVKERNTMIADIGTWPKNRQILHEIVPLDTPLVVDLHITSACNFKCNYCGLHVKGARVGGRLLDHRHMPMEIFSLAIKQLAEFPDKIKMCTMSGIGEATMHPLLPQMVEGLYKSNATQKIQIISNASLLTPRLSEALVEAGLGELKISLQGLNAEMYNQIAGITIDWNQLYNNIKYFASIKGTCALKVKIADTALNNGEEKEFFDLFGDICDAVAVEHVFNYWKGTGIDVSKNIKTIKKTIYGREQQNINICRRVFTSMGVRPDGYTTSFCTTPLGFENNIQDISIKDQWNSKEFNKIRVHMLEGKRHLWPCCRDCQIIQQTWHPQDLLEGHEDEILARMHIKYHNI